MPAASTTTAVVHSSIADQGWEKDPDAAGVPVRYWGAPALRCRVGDQLRVRVAGADPLGPPRFFNGAATFDTTGRTVVSVGRDGTPTCKDAVPGSAGFLVPTLPQHALLARFGTTGAPFVLGEGWAGDAPAAELYLAVNDRVGMFNSNKGDYTVTLEIPLAFPIDGDTALVQGRNYAGPNDQYLVLQADGNLVVYRGDPVPTNALWALNRVLPDAWRTVTSVAFENDGNLVARNRRRDEVWRSTQSGGSGIDLEMDDKGTLATVRRGPRDVQTFWRSSPS